jgi:hypothetical protein
MSHGISQTADSRQSDFSCFAALAISKNSEWPVAVEKSFKIRRMQHRTSKEGARAREPP